MRFSGFDDTKKDAIETRLSVLESTFHQFMGREDDSFREVKKTLKEIMDHIDASKTYSENQLVNTKIDILSRVEREYTTKASVAEEITGVRSSLIEGIKAEHRSIMISLWLVFAGFSTATILLGWIYVNFLQTGVS